MRASVKRLLPERALQFFQSWRRLAPVEQATLVRLASLRLVGLRSDRLPWEIGRPRSVLFVCQGNILRSPMAAAIFRRELAAHDRASEIVESAGFLPPAGRQADPRGRRLASKFGVSMEEHSSQLVTSHLVDRTELIVVMDRENEARLVTLFPDAASKTVLLGAFAPERGDRGIPDPFSGTEADVAACYARIERATSRLFAALLERPAVPPRRAGPLRRVTRFALTHPWVLAQVETASRGHAAVFLLHRFSRFEHGPDGFPAPTLRRHLEWLRRRRYHFATIGELSAALQTGEPPPPRTVAFTVDDGYADFAEVAAPIFAEFDCPVSVFLVTDFLDGRLWLWWDRLRFAVEQSARRECTLELAGQPFTVAWDTPIRREAAILSLIEAVKWYPAHQRDALIRQAATRPLAVSLGRPFPPASDAPMTWDTVRRLASTAVSFGPHSCSHPIHSNEDAETSRLEIASSWQRVKDEVPGALPVYCYPNGDDRSFGPREAGYLADLGLLPGISARRQYLSVSSRPVLAGPAAAIPRFALDPDPIRFMQVASGVERLKLRWRP